MAQNATVYHQIDRNASYELSLGDITVRQNETPGVESSSLITINMTAKNSGTVPISVTFMADTFRDDAGDGCQYEYLHWCGVVAWYQINPGDSDTRTLTMPVSSAKGYDYLSSQKFLLGGIIDANTDTYGGTNTKSWLIDLKKSTNHGM